MADPVSMAAVSIGLSAGGGIAGAFGANKKGKAQKEMYEYQAGMAEYRSKIALQNRDYALQVGEDAAERFGMKARANEGTIKAVAGASGIDIGKGSKADVVASQKLVTSMDMATIRNNAARRAYGYIVESETEKQQAGLYRAAGKNAMAASKIDMASSLISGATSVASKWYQGSSGGIFGSKNNDYEIVSDLDVV